MGIIVSAINGRIGMYSLLRYSLISLCLAFLSPLVNAAVVCRCHSPAYSYNELCMGRERDKKDICDDLLASPIFGVPAPLSEVECMPIGRKCE